MKKPLGLAALVLLALILAAPPAAADALSLELGLHGGVVNTKDGNGGSFLGGGTYANLKVKGTSVVTGEVTEKKWCAHVGAGIDVSLSNRLTLNGDVRAVFLDASSVDELIDSARSNYKGDFWTVTIGLNYKLF